MIARDRHGRHAEGAADAPADDSGERSVASLHGQPPPKHRVVGVDVARGLALLGIMAVHVLPSSTGDGAPSWTWSVLAGRSAALFALLAGVSIAFLSGGSRRLSGASMRGARTALAVRGLLIVLAGLLLGFTDSPNLIILTYYGVMFLLALPLLGLRVRWLLAVALASVTVWPIVMQVLRSENQAFRDQVPDYTISTAFSHPMAFGADMLLMGGYPALPWMGYICVGMAAGRFLGAVSRRNALALVLWGGALAATAWTASAVLLGVAGGSERLLRATPGLSAPGLSQILVFGPSYTLPTTTWWWLTVLAPYSTTPLSLLHTLGTALLVLGVTMLASHHIRWVIIPLAAMGSMTLTLYAAHIVVVAVGTFHELSPRADFTAQVGLFIGFSMLWKHWVGRGPLESIVSAVTGRVRDQVRSSSQR